MPGIHVTDRQVRRYMSSRKDGYSQAAAAARAGFSERTGRRIEAKPVLPSQREGRRYRTRPDPFAEVWLDELVPMLEAVPQIRATTLLEELQVTEDLGDSMDDLEDFVKATPIKISGLPLQWWCHKDQRKTYPQLSGMAIDILSIAPESGVSP